MCEGVWGQDEKAIAATQRLIFLLRKQPLGAELQKLSVREVQEVAAAVARKLWRRRSGLLLTGNRSPRHPRPWRLACGRAHALCACTASAAVKQRQRQRARVRSEEG